MFGAHEEPTGWDALVASCERRVGRVVGPWRLDALIDVGRVTGTYAATHRSGALAAVGIVHPRIAATPGIPERFSKLARTSNAVAHPGAVDVLDDGIADDGCPYLATELQMGESVSQWVNRVGGRLPILDVLRLSLATLNVLRAAHERGLIHGDIRPETLFITRSGTLQVLDFGLAGLRDVEGVPDATGTGPLTAAPAFTAPEQMTDGWGAVGPHTDVWAVGALMFALLTGRPVWPSSPSFVREAPSLAQVFPGAPEPLVLIVDRAVASEAERRYPNADAMREHVEPYVQHVAAAPQSVPAVHPSNAAPPPGPTDGQPNDQPSESSNRDAAIQLLRRPSPSLAAHGVEHVRLFWDRVEQALIARELYGPAHPTAAEALNSVVEFAEATLPATEHGLLWHVTPYSFEVGSETVWEAGDAFHWIPHGIYGAGIRGLGLLPGLAGRDLIEFIHIVSRPASATLPEDDVATLLWEQNLAHVVYTSIEAPGRTMTLAQRGRLERTVQRLAAESEPGPRDRAGGSGDGAAMGLNDAFASILGDLQGRVGNIQPDPRSARSAMEQALTVDRATRESLARAVFPDTLETGRRFVRIANVAHAGSQDHESVAGVTRAFQLAVSSLASSDPPVGATLVNALATTRPRRADQTVETDLASESLGDEALEAMLLDLGDRQPDRTTQAFEDTLRHLLEHLDSRPARPLVRLLEDLEPGPARHLVLRYVARHVGDHAVSVRDFLRRASADHAIPLIRALGQVEHPVSIRITSETISNPDPVVQFAALVELEGPSSDRARQTLDDLFASEDVQRRLEGLRSMAHHRIFAATPRLEQRVREPTFVSLDTAEQKLTLEALGLLAPRETERAIRVILEAASRRRSKIPQTLVRVAVEILGRLAIEASSLALLDSIATQKRRYEGATRDAANLAATMLRTRQEASS